MRNAKTINITTKSLFNRLSMEQCTTLYIEETKRFFSIWFVIVLYFLYFTMEWIPHKYRA